MLRDKNNDNDRSHFEKFFQEKEAMLRINNEDLNLCQRLELLRSSLQKVKEKMDTLELSNKHEFEANMIRERTVYQKEIQSLKNELSLKALSLKK